jgi:plastocyanin
MALTTTPSLKLRVALAGVAASALLLTGCTSGDDAPDVDDDPTTVEATMSADDDANTDTDDDSDDADDSDDGATGMPVTASATEFAYALSQAEFTAGTYTFELINDGSMQHDLVIEGPGVEAASDVIGSGESTTLTVDLEPGTYVLYCSIGDHRAMGMEVTITVT